jgi:hypothetical protein
MKKIISQDKGGRIGLHNHRDGNAGDLRLIGYFNVFMAGASLHQRDTEKAENSGNEFYSLLHNHYFELITDGHFL